MSYALNDSVLQKSWICLLEGDERGISGLYDTMWEKLYTYAARILQDKSVASDLIQDLFIGLWEKREKLPDVVNVEGYLFRSLKHAVINYLHSAGVREKHMEAFNKAAAKMDDRTLEIIYQKELVQRIKESSESLPERMRQIFLMNRFEHKSVSEIAKELNLSEQTVRNQINLALKKIKPGIIGTLTLIWVLYVYQYLK